MVAQVKGKRCNLSEALGSDGLGFGFWVLGFGFRVEALACAKLLNW